MRFGGDMYGDHRWVDPAGAEHLVKTAPETADYDETMCGVPIVVASNDWQTVGCWSCIMAVSAALEVPFVRA